MRSISLGPTVARARVIIDNDFGGDPDGLFQLAHHLLSPSVDVRGVIASRHYDSGFYGMPGSCAYSREQAEQLMKILGTAGRSPLMPGAEATMQDPATPAPSQAADFIIQEARRTDTQLPLYIACGAGLTNIASACIIAPDICKRLKLIWIGGPEHHGLAAPPPRASRIEYNLGIDVPAAQMIFANPDIELWQVPRNAYRQTLVSHAELLDQLDSTGPLGNFLLLRLHDLMKRSSHKLGEAYALGDSPLVLLTALQSSWEADPSSSDYVSLPAPTISPNGQYQTHRTDRPIRVYQRLDVRLMLADLYAKIRAFDRSTNQDQALPN